MLNGMMDINTVYTYYATLTVTIGQYDTIYREYHNGILVCSSYCREMYVSGLCMVFFLDTTKENYSIYVETMQLYVGPTSSPIGEVCT